MSAWVIGRFTEEDERKEIDVYCDFEGFASPKEVLELFGEWRRSRSYHELQEWQEIILIHLTHEFVDTCGPLSEVGEEVKQDHFHELDGAYWVIQHKRTAWMSHKATYGEGDIQEPPPLE